MEKKRKKNNIKNYPHIKDFQSKLVEQTQLTKREKSLEHNRHN